MGGLMSLITTYRQSGSKRDLRKYWFLLISLVLASIQTQAQNGWTLKAPLPTPRVGATAGVVGGKIYVIGGYIDIANNEVYDPSTDTWEQKAPMPTPRGFPFSGVVNDTMYVMGGGVGVATTRVEAYVPATDSWDTTKADLLLARIASNAALVDGILYHAGGSYNRTECQAYCTHPNSCQLGTSIPDSLGQRGALSATAYDGLVYTFGGSNYSPWSPLSAVCAYDPQTDSWAAKKDMPTARFGFQTYLVGNKIYAIGGSQLYGTALATVEVYDPENNSWDTTTPDMPHALCWFAGAVVNNRIYVIGGTTDWTVGGNELWEYDPSVVSVEHETSIPEQFALLQNYPNPFNPATSITYDLPEVAHVTLEVWNAIGQRIALLTDGIQQPGHHEVTFDANGLAGGIYLYRLTAGRFVATKKMILLK
jgi:N-acetylneuraminic acid mutarotase